MPVKNVKVVNVETVTKDKEGKDLKTPRLVLSYVANNGETWTIGALASKLSSASRATLKEAKEKVEAGTEVIIAAEIAKDGNYWNLMSAAPATAESPQTKGSYQAQPYNSSKGKETDTRIQVMNALTNAVVSLGAGKTPGEYKARVIEFVALGNQVVEEALAGKLTEGVAKQAPDEQVLPELGF